MSEKDTTYGRLFALEPRYRVYRCPHKGTRGSPAVTVAEPAIPVPLIRHEIVSRCVEPTVCGLRGRHHARIGDEGDEGVHDTELPVFKVAVSKGNLLVVSAGVVVPSLAGRPAFGQHQEGRKSIHNGLKDLIDVFAVQTDRESTQIHVGRE